jgi:superoxide reductase
MGHGYGAAKSNNASSWEAYHGKQEKQGKEETMPAKGEFYRCTICGNVVEVKQAGDGDLSCCGMPMEGLTENEAATFKD